MGQMHTVEQGEYLASIAKYYEFADWHIIYDHPQNAEFRKKRPNPNILLPGDQLYIPDKQEKDVSCSTDQIHKFQLNAPKNILKLTLKDTTGKPIRNQPYNLIFGHKTMRGTTDGQGLLQCQIPRDVHEAQLILNKLHLTWNLKIGHLDPIEEKDEDKALNSGAHARLNNLGFFCGDVDGVLDSDMKGAIRMFQTEVMGREPDRATGELDQETRAALEREHMC